jgi:predicted  nucleic acid-binding Zn-ribbon protein
VVIGVLEDVNFNKRYETITQNQNGIDRHITRLEMKIDELEKENKDIREIVENIESIVYQISKKI